MHLWMSRSRRNHQRPDPQIAEILRGDTAGDNDIGAGGAQQLVEIPGNESIISTSIERAKWAGRGIAPCLLSGVWVCVVLVKIVSQNNIDN